MCVCVLFNIKKRTRDPYLLPLVVTPRSFFQTETPTETYNRNFFTCRGGEGGGRGQVAQKFFFIFLFLFVAQQNGRLEPENQAEKVFRYRFNIQ